MAESFVDLVDWRFGRFGAGLVESELSFKKFRRQPDWLNVSQASVCTEYSDAAWKQIEAISAAVRDSKPDLGSGDFYLQTLTRVLNAVEVLAQELRINFTDHVPGSHIFSLNDFVKSRKIAKKGGEVYRLFRVVSAGIDPVSAAIRELRIATTTNLLAESTGDLKRWLIDAYVKKIGYYAIELYSGNLVLDDDGLVKPSRQTQQELQTIRQREQALAAEPFRVLVAGQVNAGKASLINAIAGRWLAVADAAPNIFDRQAYLIDRDDFPAGMLVDCRRYDDSCYPKQRLAVLEQAANSDAVIVVISAVNPALRIDKAILDGMRRLDHQPRILVALTQIDKIRPLREWAPPYDLTTPRSAKGKAIKNAVLDVAGRLDISVEQVVPMSLRDGRVYNCEEQLVPILLQQFKHAEGKRRLRSLQAYQREMRQKQLKVQLRNGGKWLVKIGFGLAAKHHRREDCRQKPVGGRSPLPNNRAPTLLNP